MTTDLPGDGRGDAETKLADTIVEWIDREKIAESDEIRGGKPCAACGDPNGHHQLLLTIDWEHYLSERHDVPPPEGECRVPLCTRCRSWAEMLEIAEMKMHDHAATDRERIVEERNRLLDSIKPELVTNLRVSESLEEY